MANFVSKISLSWWAKYRYSGKMLSNKWKLLKSLETLVACSLLMSHCMICWILRPLLPCLFSKTCFWLFWNVKKQVLYKNRYFDCMSESFLMKNWHDSLTFFIYTHKKYQENTFIVHCFRPFFSVQPFFLHSYQEGFSFHHYIHRTRGTCNS